MRTAGADTGRGKQVRATVHPAEPYRLSTYDYELPPDLIAQHPSACRDESRLLVLRRRTGRISHHVFRELPDFLSPSDLLVMNETRVVPSLLVGHKPTGGRVELLVLDPARSLEGGALTDPAVRVCMVRSSKPLKSGARVKMLQGPELTAEETVAPGRVRIQFPVSEGGLLGFLDAYGRPPLPPYIQSLDRDADRDRERYQTVYAQVSGSVAAPTAGLHFTDELLGELSRKEIEIAKIVLHVGPGTFTPVRSDDIREHKMESEHYEIPEKAARRIVTACREGRRIVAVGTTSVRALESAASPEGVVRAGRGETDLFIAPGYSFKVVGGLITNFHLPRSTLLMLVSSFAGTHMILRSYMEAVRHGYRFYSYGDSCLIVD